MKEGLIVAALGILVVFSGLALIFIAIAVKGYIFSHAKTSKNIEPVKKIKMTDEILTAIGLALYFHDLFNKNYQEEVTIQKLTPPVSTWVVAGRGTTLGKFIWSYRRKWR